MTLAEDSPRHRTSQLELTVFMANWAKEHTAYTTIQRAHVQNPEQAQLAKLCLPRGSVNRYHYQ